MSDILYPQSTPVLAHKRRDLTPETEAAFRAFSRQVFADGALPAKTKQLMAVAGAHVTQVPLLHPRPYQGSAPGRRQPSRK